MPSGQTQGSKQTALETSRVHRAVSKETDPQVTPKYAYAQAGNPPKNNKVDGTYSALAAELNQLAALLDNKYATPSPMLGAGTISPKAENLVPGTAIGTVTDIVPSGSGTGSGGSGPEDRPTTLTALTAEQLRELQTRQREVLAHAYTTDLEAHEQRRGSVQSVATQLGTDAGGGRRSPHTQTAVARGTPAQVPQQSQYPLYRIDDYYAKPEDGLERRLDRDAKARELEAQRQRLEAEGQDETAAVAVLVSRHEELIPATSPEGLEGATAAQLPSIDAGPSQMSGASGSLSKSASLDQSQQV